MGVSSARDAPTFAGGLTVAAIESLGGSVEWMGSAEDLAAARHGEGTEGKDR